MTNNETVAKQILFTQTIGSDRGNGQLLTPILPNPDYVNFQVEDISLINIIGQLREREITDANLIANGDCVAKIIIREHGVDGFHGKVDAANGMTLFIKEATLEPEVAVNSPFSPLRRNFTPVTENMVEAGGLTYYPQFLDIYPCHDYPGVATGVFRHRSPEPLVTWYLNLRSQKLSIVADVIEFTDLGKFDKLEWYWDRGELCSKEKGNVETMRELLTLRKLNRADKLIVEFTVQDIFIPTLEDLLKTLGYDDDTKGRWEYHQFILDDEAETTFGQYKAVVKQILNK